MMDLFEKKEYPFSLIRDITGINEEAGMLDIFHKSLSHIGVDGKKMIELRYRNNLPYEDIAKKFNVTETAVITKCIVYLNKLTLYLGYYCGQNGKIIS